jgi:hypothetical protein
MKHKIKCAFKLNMINLNAILIILGLISLAIIGVVIAKLFERNPDKAESLSSWVGIPLVLVFYYLYIQNFSFITYLFSIGALVLLFI